MSIEALSGVLAAMVSLAKVGYFRKVESAVPQRAMAMASMTIMCTMATWFESLFGLALSHHWR